MKTTTLAAPTSTRIACLSLAKLLSIGNLEDAAGCFARDACLLTPDATAIHDRQHIRPVLAQLIARRTQIEVQYSNVIAAGNVAFARERWLIDAQGAAGTRFEQVCDPTLVLRELEGSWKIAIAALWGWAGKSS
jgi:ketosteroid isomerase-like protein